MLDREKINSILENTTLQPYEIKYQSLLKWLARESDFSSRSVKGNSNNLASSIGASDGNEVMEILDDLWGERLIAVEYPASDSLRKIGNALGFQVHLTAKGIKKAREKPTEMKTQQKSPNIEYDIVFSFAGEDRKYVKEVADCLIESGVKVFYDEFEEDSLWGRDLYVYLDEIYRKKGKYCLMFLSKDYAKKLWTNHERESAQARAFQQSEEYILPIKLDDTEIPGIRPTTGYQDGRKKTPREICGITLKKLKIVTPIKGIQENEDENKIYIPKVHRTVSDLEKKKFIKTSFDEIREYFQNALTELGRVNKNLDTELEQITNSKFMASVYVEGELRSRCKIWIGGMFGSENSISFSEGIKGLAIQNDNTINDSASVIDDGVDIYFSLLGLTIGHIDGIENIDLKHANTQAVAKYYWGRFVQNVNK